MIRPLDKYVFTEFWKIFVSTALGFPILVFIVDLTDNLDTYLDRNLHQSQIALSYLYWLPESMFLILPAAVLFATVFSIGAFTRHSEITAAKASGMSFYRFIAPTFAGALLAAALGLALGELAPPASKRRLELLEANKFSATDRYNFAYASDNGRVYKVSALHITANEVLGFQVERKGRGADYPSFILGADHATYKPGDGWKVGPGSMHLITGDRENLTFTFDSLRDAHFRERPIELTASPKAPSEMRYKELGRFIHAMERSGADVNQLKVERMLKIAIPITSLVILLFAAPLATSTQRGGAAYGIGISLATTVIFLLMIQLTKAVGSKGLIPPEVAAWVPSMIFGVIGIVMLSRVRT